MIGLLKSRLEDVYDVVLVANTPAYLYKKLRRVLFDVANLIPFQTVVSELRSEIASSPSDEYDQVSYVYTLFILLTYGRYEDVQQQLGWIRSIQVKWMYYLTNPKISDSDLEDRGRNAGYPAPPAQIRTCALTHTAPTFGG